MQLRKKSNRHPRPRRIRARGAVRSCMPRPSNPDSPTPHRIKRRCTYNKNAQVGSCSRDPIGYKDGPNVYSFLHIQPTVMVDPNGTDAYWVGGTTPSDHSIVCVDDHINGGYYCCEVQAGGTGVSSGSGSSAGTNQTGILGTCGLLLATIGIGANPSQITCGNRAALPDGGVTTCPQGTDGDLVMWNTLRSDAGTTWIWNAAFSSCHQYVRCVLIRRGLY